MKSTVTCQLITSISTLLAFGSQPATFFSSYFFPAATCHYRLPLHCNQQHHFPLTTTGHTAAAYQHLLLLLLLWCLLASDEQTLTLVARHCWEKATVGKRQCTTTTTTIFAFHCPFLLISACLLSIIVESNHRRGRERQWMGP